MGKLVYALPVLLLALLAQGAGLGKSSVKKLKLSGDMDAGAHAITNAATLVLTNGFDLVDWATAADGSLAIVSNQLQALDAVVELQTNKNLAGGYAGLDENGLIEPEAIPDIVIIWTGGHAEE